MRVEGIEHYRVREVADDLGTSVSTIYRAVTSGRLRALRFGTGKGAIRVPVWAVAEYVRACERAAVARGAAGRVA